MLVAIPQRVQVVVSLDGAIARWDIFGHDDSLEIFCKSSIHRIAVRISILQWNKSGINKNCIIYNFMV